jgi:hypothetical protein
VFVGIVCCQPFPQGEVSIFDCLYEYCFYGRVCCSLKVADCIFYICVILHIFGCVVFGILLQVAFFVCGVTLCVVEVGCCFYAAVSGCVVCEWGSPHTI